MDLLPQGQLLDPEIGDMVKGIHRFLNLWILKGTFVVVFLFVYKPLKIHKRKSITLLAQ